MIDVVDSPQMDESSRLEARRLWHAAFGDRFDDNDADHAFGGVHVLVREAGRLVGDASAVPRRLRFGDGPWRAVGYVEAVAVEPEWQRRGIGHRLMEVLQAEIAGRWPLAMLSTGRTTAFYESLGWTQWRGLSYTLTASGSVVPDGEHGGLMVLVIDPSAEPDLDAAVTCEDRPGDAW